MSEVFKLSRDPLFIDKVRDVVGLYLNPPDRALVLCVDEKPQIQATEGTAPVLPTRPGQPEQRSHDYIRHGTRALEQAIEGYIAATNADPKPFVWTKTADEILESVARYCQRTSDPHH